MIQSHHNEIKPVISFKWKHIYRRLEKKYKTAQPLYGISLSEINILFNYILTTFTLMPDYSSAHRWQETPSSKLDAEDTNRKWLL